MLPPAACVMILGAHCGVEILSMLETTEDVAIFITDWFVGDGWLIDGGYSPIEVLYKITGLESSSAARRWPIMLDWLITVYEPAFTARAWLRQIKPAGMLTYISKEFIARPDGFTYPI